MNKQTISATARLIAKATILNANDDATRNIVTPRAGELSQAFLADGAWVDRHFTSLLRVPGIKTLLFTLERLIKPGLTIHYALRKRVIEDLVLRHIDDGQCRQVVVLGAGFDTLSLRVSISHPRVQFFEIDRPSVIQSKVRGLARIREAPENIHFVPCNEVEDFVPTLFQRCEFLRDANTLVLIEGVLMYLASDQVRRLFRDLRGMSCSTSAIFTYLQPIGAYEATNRPIAERLSDLWLHRKGESYLWRVTPEELVRLCEELGFRLQSSVCPRDDKDAFRALSISKRSQTLPRDEWVARGVFV